MFITITIIVVVLPVFIFASTKWVPRFIKLDSRWESLAWTWRLMNWKFSFPEKLEEWNYDQGVTRERIDSIQHAWEFLHPFFASRGYAMYQKDPTGDDLLPAPSPPVAKNATYPYAYARQVPSNKPERMGWGSVSIWGARDVLGRDVVIKVISEVNNTSQELKVMQRLNSKRLRSDPYNHTIYALDFLTFDKFVFVVMPRWDNAFSPEFAIVSELMSFALTCFQTFAFLHRNRIVHCDFLPQNIGINAVIEPTEIRRRTGMRNPKEVRYALYDFGSSIAYPEDAVIEETFTLTRDHNLDFHTHNISPTSIADSYNPFKVDIAFLGACLQRRVRHLEHMIPELGPFFDMLVDINDPKQLTASQALDRFSEICDNLSPEVTQKPFDTWLWDYGVIRKKQGNIITVLESPAL